jgi:hypothetical protein
MKMRIWLFIALLFAMAGFSFSAKAQISQLQIAITPTCSTQSLAQFAGQPYFKLYMDYLGELCTNATGGGGGGAVTIADGDVVNAGTTTDAASAAGGTGTMSAKLRETTSLLNSALTQETSTATNTGTLAARSAARTSVSSTALEANHVITAFAGSLYSFEVQADATLSAAAWWIMIYNATSAPADGTVTPIKCYQVPAGNPGANYAFPNPIAFSTGIVIGVSTTGCFTKTASAHAFISGDF